MAGRLPADPNLGSRLVDHRLEEGVEVAHSRRTHAAGVGSAPQTGPSGAQTPNHRAAAQALRSATSDVVDAYRAELLRVDSVLAVRPEAWQSCRRQALAILHDCVVTLENGALPETSEAEEYSRLLGAHRALQKIPVAESVRATELLWSAMQPAVHAAAACEAPTQRAVVWQKVNAAFRAAASVRLYAGTLGHEETRDRILTSTGEEPPAESPKASPAPGRADDREPPEELTARERQVLDAVARAFTNRQIARHLGISEGTVKRHLYNIFNKLGATSRMDAVLKGAGRR